jgi:phage-related protein
LYNQTVDRPLSTIRWHGDTLEQIRGFPDSARQDVGYQLERVQQGLEPRDWKPMSVVGPGVVEIRVHAQNEYRVLYLARRNDVVHVLHAFVKKTRQTRKADIEMARKRFRELSQPGGVK